MPPSLSESAVGKHGTYIRPFGRNQLQKNLGVASIIAIHALSIPILLVACGLANGCIVVPHPVSKKVAGAGGSTLSAEPNSSEIRVGATTRREIETMFADVNAGWSSKNMFLGRWARSGMGLTGERAWGARTLVVEFDDRGIAKRFHECGDRELVKILPEYLRAQPDRPLFAEPMERTIGAGKLLIEKDTLVLNGERIPRSSILGINDITIPLKNASAHSAKSGKGPDPLQVYVGLVLSPSRERPSLLEFETDVATVVLLMQFVSQ